MINTLTTKFNRIISVDRISCIEFQWKKNQRINSIGDNETLFGINLTFIAYFTLQKFNKNSIEQFEVDINSFFFSLFLQIELGFVFEVLGHRYRCVDLFYLSNRYINHFNGYQWNLIYVISSLATSTFYNFQIDSYYWLSDKVELSMQYRRISRGNERTEWKKKKLQTCTEWPLTYLICIVFEKIIQILHRLRRHSKNENSKCWSIYGNCFCLCYFLVIVRFKRSTNIQINSI